MVQTSKTDHFGCSKNGVICYMLWSSNVQEITAETTILSEYLKLEEKSVFNFMNTRFDWERLDFAKCRIFSF